MRTLRKTPTFAAVAIVSLAVGIGLNASILSAVRAVLLADLPYADANRVVSVAQRYGKFGCGGVAPAAYLEWARQNRVFESMGAFDGFNFDGVLRSGDVTQRIGVMWVSSGFFRVLGRQSALGRVFGSNDDRPGSNVAILSDEWWRRQWRADPAILGHTITIEGVSYEIVGVMPRGFAFYHVPYEGLSDAADVWVSDPFASNDRSNTSRSTLGAIARLKQGVSVSQANSAMSTLAAAVGKEQHFPAVDGACVTPVAEALSEPSRRLLLICCSVAALLLLIAVFNLAALGLARTESRRSEFGLRAAVGASRARIIRQVLTENVLLGTAGGALGIAFAAWSEPLLHRLIPGADTMVRLSEARLSASIVLTTVGLSMGAGVAVGLGSAWLACRSELRRGYGHGRGATIGRVGARFRGALVLAQLVMSLIILSATGLLFATALREYRVPLGFDARHLLSMHVRYPHAAPYVTPLGIRSYSEGPTGTMEQHPLENRAPHFALTSYGIDLPDRLSERLRRVPGVRAVGVASMMPFQRSFSDNFRVEGRVIPASEAEGVSGGFCAVTPGFFEAFGMKVLAGRALQPSDRLGAPRVMVVNATLARDFLGGASRAVGRRILVNPSAGRFDAYEVVGVVSDVRWWTRHEVAPGMFIAFAQAVDPAYDDVAVTWRLDHWIAVRTVDDSATRVASIVRALELADHGAPVEGVEFLSTIIARGSGHPQALLMLLASGGALAILLAAIGIFGTTAFTVSQRTQEIGIRVALGASRRAIMTGVMSAGGRVALGGILAGSLGAYWTNQLLADQLYGVKPTEPIVSAAAAGLLVLVVLLATWLAARRAAAVDPIVALRAE